MLSILRILPPILGLLAASSSLTRSQDPGTSAPAVASCQPQLLSLVPCAPFVQGTAPSPPQSCCGVLNQIYSQQPHCLCILLNATDILSVPINNTLALQLPHLCNVPADPSSCGSVPVRPAPQVSLGRNSSHSVAASPASVSAPGPSMTGPHESSGGRAESDIEFRVKIAAGGVLVMTMLMLA